MKWFSSFPGGFFIAPQTHNEVVYMAKVIYENDRAILSFESQDVIKTLYRHIKEYKLPHDSELMAWIVNQSNNGNVDVTIEEDEGLTREFGHRIIYVVRGLLLKEKGTVFCKSCRKTIPASNIHMLKRSISNHLKGIDSKIIKTMKQDYGLSGIIDIGGLGGTRFYCDHDHEIFSVMEWIS
jgi:hypothetical protein